MRAGDRVLVVGENAAAAACWKLALQPARRLVDRGQRAAVGARDRHLHRARRHPPRDLHLPCVGRCAEARAAPWRRGAGLGRHRDPVGRPAGPARCRPEPCARAPQEQVASLIYTSGTSGAPKGVMLTHANLMFAAASARDIRGLGPGDLIYGVLPMAHVVGLSTQIPRLHRERGGAAAGGTLRAGRLGAGAGAAGRDRLHRRAGDVPPSCSTGPARRDSRWRRRPCASYAWSARQRHASLKAGVEAALKAAAAQRLRPDRNRPHRGADPHRGPAPGLHRRLRAAGVQTRGGRGLSGVERAAGEIGELPGARPQPHEGATTATKH